MKSDNTSYPTRSATVTVTIRTRDGATVRMTAGIPEKEAFEVMSDVERRHGEWKRRKEKEKLDVA